MADPSIHAELAAIRDQFSRLEREVGRIAGAFEGLREHRNEQVEALGDDADRQRDAVILFTGKLTDFAGRLAIAERDREVLAVLTKRVEEVETTAEKVSRQLDVITALANQPWKWLERAGVLVAIFSSIALAWFTYRTIPQPREQQPTEQHK